MPDSQKDRVDRWTKKIASANKVYDEWQDKFHVQRLENYYEGFQWAGVTEENAKDKYTINLVYAEIETTRPALLFYRPRIKMLVRPGREDALGSTVQQQAQLCEDTTQTFVDDPDVGFAQETGLGLQESFFRFGVVEVGYGADWVDNPNAGKPVLQDDGGEDPLADEGGATITQPEKVLRDGTRESLYVKWIPARNFRVSLSDRNRMETNDWVAYYEWHYVEDLKRNKAYRNTKDLKPSGMIADTYRTTEDGNETERHHGMVRLWKIWDIRTHERHVIADGHSKFLLEGKRFTFLPLAALKFHERLGHFYPLPPVWNWLSPQDEKNEIREQRKVHRRRFNRRYLMRTNTISQEELDKLESGEDGVYATHTGAPGEQPLMPVPDAPLDAATWRDLAASDQDFAQVAGSTSESRGIPQAQTATQATIMNTHDQLRETAGRVKVAEWIAAIARLMLLTTRENMALDFWIKRNVDLQAESALSDAQRVAELWRKITADDLGNIDLDVSVELASMSPVTEDMQRALWNQVIALISNPMVAAQLAASDVLLRKTLGLYGIKAESEIQEIKRACQALVQQMQALAAAKQGVPGVTATAGAPGALGQPGQGGGPRGLLAGAM